MSDEATVTVKLAKNEQAVVDAIEKLTVVEANNVAKYFEEKYGISAAAAPVAVAAAAGGTTAGGDDAADGATPLGAGTATVFFAASRGVEAAHGVMGREQ